MRENHRILRIRSSSGTSRLDAALPNIRWMLWVLKPWVFLSSPKFRPQWEHRCSHHSRCIRMPRLTWAHSDSEKLWQTIAAHCKYQKQKAKKVCNLQPMWSQTYPVFFSRSTLLHMACPKQCCSIRFRVFLITMIFSPCPDAPIYTLPPVPETKPQLFDFWVPHKHVTMQHWAKFPGQELALTHELCTSKPNTRHFVGRIDRLNHLPCFMCLDKSASVSQAIEFPG